MNSTDAQKTSIHSINKHKSYSVFEMRIISCVFLWEGIWCVVQNKMMELII